MPEMRQCRRVASHQAAQPAAIASTGGNQEVVREYQFDMASARIVLHITFIEYEAVPHIHAEVEGRHNAEDEDVGRARAETAKRRQAEKRPRQRPSRARSRPTKKAPGAA